MLVFCGMMEKIPILYIGRIAAGTGESKTLHLRDPGEKTGKPSESYRFSYYNTEWGMRAISEMT